MTRRGRAAGSPPLTATLLLLVAAVSLVACTAAPADQGSVTTAATTAPTTRDSSPGSSAPTSTEAAAGTTSTIDLRSLVLDTTTTASTIPPAGTPLPGGPVRAKVVPQPVPPGPCTESVGRVDRLTFQSNVLAINQPTQSYRVYTPKCYRYDVATRYPVVYLFHGAQADDSQWEDVGIFTVADQLIATGAIAPVIIVLSDGIWAMGTYEGEPPLFDRFVLGEVMPAIEQDYRVIADKGHRAVGGISRGGEWALILGGRHPDLFVAVGGHSPAVGAPSTPNSYLVPLYRASRGQRLWLDVGAGDGLVAAVGSLHDAWSAAGINHEHHVNPGGHDRAYWRAQSEAYLRFYSSSWGTS